MYVTSHTVGNELILLATHLFLVLEKAPLLAGVWGSGDIAPSILNLNTRSEFLASHRGRCTL